MKRETSNPLQWGKIFSVSTILLGVILMGYMIMYEDEPGAVPFLMIVLGTAWFFMNRYKIRKRVN